ncbi:glycosyltransferase family 2 protein [Flavobacterium aciduliphilum]|uniref:GT2 family glycosyltransferase n=1 Tax=Flavobacterium aciduliphilum TaxID=1101402 RepID=A0A328YTW3_9FLAO|nr:glycosyltransferase family 2 protein [Flavobacterium aciduliphilum]RAR75652.1 GT2 family glycosyltransferase [Flavobacterium aciduliphilum]
MQLSVIILNYNVRYFLEQCVLSVQKALEGMDGEIIVVDNHSSDESCAMMKQRFPNVKLIENTENVGFPKGNNIGVAQAKGEYICILNPDTVVAEDTFKKIAAFFEVTDNVGVVGCKLIDGTGTFLPESKRGVPTPWVAITKICGFYKFSDVFGKYYAQHLSENQSGKVDILVGAFMVMKRNLYLEVGGFDEKCFMYSDDIDLSYMVLQKGKTNYYFPETTVIHYKGESTIRDEKYMKRFQEAMQFFYNKHFKKSVVFDFFMKIGALAFSFLKKKQSVSQKRAIDEYVIFSKEKLYLHSGKKETILNDLIHFKNDFQNSIEVVFDTKSFSYKEIIAFMNSHKSKNLTFKNYIYTSNYLIGSNNAIDRGEVWQVKN